MVPLISIMHSCHNKLVNTLLSIHKIKTSFIPICNSFINYEYSTLKLLFINLCILHRYLQPLSNTNQNINIISLLNNRNYNFNIDSNLPIYNLMTLELSKRNICHNLDDEIICTVFKLFSKYDLTM